MNDTLVTAFTITLSFIGIMISAAALVLAIIYIIKLRYIQQTQFAIDNDLKQIDLLTKALVADCGCIYPLFGSQSLDYHIEGIKIIAWYKEKYKIDNDLQAVVSFKSQNEEETIELYIKECDSEIEKTPIGYK